ncbi:MAG: hypothetical protein ABI877_18810, partial [Gemmatimonadaceae bacterium]
MTLFVSLSKAATSSESSAILTDLRPRQSRFVLISGIYPAASGIRESRLEARAPASGEVKPSAVAQ